MTMRLWIDTDIGDDPDDAVALCCAAAHPGLELVGVSTVDGDHARRATAARELVDVPIVAEEAVVDALCTTAPAALLAIGPLTNVARVLEAGALPPRLAVMGGALAPVRHRGAVRSVEHNFGRDPAAARQVLAGVSGILVTPLDVSARMGVDGRALRELLDAAPVLRPAVESWTASQPPGTGLCLHDPLALLALADEPVVTTEHRSLAVEADGRVTEPIGAPRHEVVVSADTSRALERILELLARR